MNPTREEVLISRVVDRAEDPRDWRELDRLAATSEAVWYELVDALRQDAVVRSAMQPALDAADRVELPVMRHELAPAPSRERAPFAAWSGWLAAVLIAAFWIGMSLGNGAAPTEAELAGGEPPAGAPADAEVLGELSRVVMQAQPTDDGSALEVLYIRRVLERAVVDALYQISEDEHGLPVPTPVSLAQFDTPSRY